MIEAVTFSSPIVRGHQQPLSSGHVNKKKSPTESPG